jgi:hypothetical protein
MRHDETARELPLTGALDGPQPNADAAQSFGGERPSPAPSRVRMRRSSLRRLVPLVMLAT